MAQMYDLRCVFEYVNKPVWRSMWNRSGDLPSDQAFMQSKEGLLFAVIEGKDIQTRKVVRMVEIPGCDFCNFQWVAVQNLPVLGSKNSLSRNIGLTMVTRNENIIILNDGVITVTQRNNSEDKFMHYGRVKI